MKFPPEKSVAEPTIPHFTILVRNKKLFNLFDVFTCVNISAPLMT